MTSDNAGRESVSAAIVVVVVVVAGGSWVATGVSAAVKGVRLFGEAAESDSVWAPEGDWDWSGEETGVNSAFRRI